MPKALPASTQAKTLFPKLTLEETASAELTEPTILEGADVWSAVRTLAPPMRVPLGSEVIELDQASYIIEQANLQAEGIKMRAEMMAEAVLEDAQAEANIIRKKAHDQGYQDGIGQARRDVEAELTAKFDERCASLNSDVDKIVSQIVNERQAMWESMESEITQFALEIARKVTKIESDRNNDLIMGVIKDAMRRVSDRANVRILVNPTEVAHVRASREDLMTALDGIKNLEIDGDRRIGRGGCVIETDAGSVDAKIETQFEQVESVLEN